jgi:hypothetical protein
MEEERMKKIRRSEGGLKNKMDNIYGIRIYHR